MDEFGQQLKDPVGPFNEGSHLNLICEAEGGEQDDPRANPRDLHRECLMASMSVGNLSHFIIARAFVRKAHSKALSLCAVICHHCIQG